MFSLSKIQSAIDLIAQSDGLVIAAGAGMGVDSGLPDFRGNEGFWKAYPALGAQKMPFHEIASPAAFRRRPAEAWGFYGHRLNLYRRTIPHVGFDILLKWATAKPMGYSIFTSNVDGQFQRAGFDPQHIHECHGSIHHMQCMLPCRQSTWSAEAFHPEINTGTCQLSNRLPVCPHCGGLARPNILTIGIGLTSTNNSNGRSSKHGWKRYVARWSSRSVRVRRSRQYVTLASASYSVMVED